MKPASPLQLIATAMLIAIPYLSSLAQHTLNYAVHANIIYHFTKYVDWPDNKKSGDFVIGIVGGSAVFEELQRITENKTAGSQKIIIKKLSPAQQSYDCHILFITSEETTSLKKISARTEGKPVLLVCEDEGSASKGACINFNVVSDRLKLEINKNNIQQHQLNIANELLQLGVLVK